MPQGFSLSKPLSARRTDRWSSHASSRGLRSLDSQTAFIVETMAREGPSSEFAKHPFRTGAFTLTNSILGGGISLISLPIASRCAGLVLGPLLLFAAACVSAFTLSLLVDCRIHTGARTFHELGQVALGKHFGALCVKCCIVTNNFGVCTALFLIVSDMALQFLEQNTSISTTKPAILLASYAFVLPFAMCRRLVSLQYVSLLAICCVFAFVFMSAATAVSEDDFGNIETLPLFRLGGEALLALPLCSLAFACQFIMLPIVNTCPPRATRRVMPKVITSSMLCCMVVYLIEVTAVNLTFAGRPLDGNVLKNYNSCLQTHPWTASTVLAFMVALLLTIPLFHFECRENLDALLFPEEYEIDEEENADDVLAVDGPLNVQDASDSPDSSEDGQYGAFGRHPPQESRVSASQAQEVECDNIPTFRFTALTTCTLLAAAVIPMFVDSVDVVLGYIGATVVIAITYILPCALYLKLISASGWKRTMAIITLVLGSCLVPTLVTITSLEALGRLHYD